MLMLHICADNLHEEILSSSKLSYHLIGTVMILIFRTDRSGQTVQTQIRLLLAESLLFAIPFASFQQNTLRFGLFLCLNFRLITAKFSGVRKFRSFTVNSECSPRTRQSRLDLFDFLLKVHGKQLRACRDDQLSLQHATAGLAQAVNQYSVLI